MTEQVVCSRNHRLVRFDSVPCRAHGQHRTYRCPMRLGHRACGELVVLPPFGEACGDEEDER
jgi:hypothetical protein